MEDPRGTWRSGRWRLATAVMACATAGSLGATGPAGAVPLVSASLSCAHAGVAHGARVHHLRVHPNAPGVCAALASSNQVVPANVVAEVTYWLAHVTQTWGTTSGGPAYEEGVDASMPLDSPVVAIQGGPVLGRGRFGGGGVVSIDAGGVAEYYQHLDCVFVEPGQRVSAGQVIGTSGGQLAGGRCADVSTCATPQTCFSTGPHIEFGLDATYESFWNPRHWTPNRNPVPFLRSLLLASASPNWR
ncbi:MAG: M23 family metallopeptidase [Acidimicrobiales bacterium]